MEYLIIGSIAIAVFIFLLIIVKVEVLRNKANALFLQAEKYINEDKFNYVCEKLYIYVPVYLKWLIDEEMFRDVIQIIYNNSREVAKDILDDGKINKSNKEDQ